MVITRMRMMGLIGICVVIGLIGMTTALSSEGKVNAETELAKQKIFMAPKAAKSFLRVRRGWKVKSLWGEEEEEEEEDNERRREARHRAYIARTCPQQCMGAWSAWTSCSLACGTSGTRSRSRRVTAPTQCAAWVRQHGCPGNTLETQGCNRRCFNGGSLRRSSCACTAGFKGQCCQQRVTCSYPGKPTNGEVSPSRSPHYYNTVARFSCHTGYRLVGSSSRKCQNSGSWSGNVPRCQTVNCENPGVPSHGSRQGSDFMYSRSILYSCMEGYILKGSKTTQCEASGRWSHPRPTCIPIRCPRPPSPSFGWIRLTDNTFRSVAQYGCDQGYHLEGSQRRTCQLNTNWDGTQPMCKHITCSLLSAPANGFVSHSNPEAVVYGTKAKFSCKLGFVLQGARERLCSGSGSVGTWTGNQPVCRAVNCGEPGVPSHGTKLGNDYRFPHSISFKCLPGYRLNGQHVRITCQASGQWTAGKPTCIACSRNTYRIGVSIDSACTQCPAHSHTVSTASTGPAQCICDTGYTGPAGGPCGVVRCPSLSPPAQGTMSACQNTVGDVCKFMCQSGYIRGFGSQTRECQTDSSWSGVHPTCTACPENTYRTNPTKCTPCPSHSYTRGTGSELTDCLCNPGFQGPSGGPCIDVDECAATGRGGCQQTCVNTIGSYRCECDIPGFVKDSDNPHRCKAEQSCQALSTPNNGGLVCAKERSTNTDRCSVKCNAGFEHLDRSNDFEECGPDTSWMWTHEINNSPVLPCVEQYFSGVQVEAEVAYFVTSCSMLTEAQQVVVRQQFLQMLQERGICTGSQQSQCQIDDVTIRCGEEDLDLFRRKRSVQMKKIKIKFHIKVDEKANHEGSCSSCTGSRDNTCLRACSQRYENEAKRTLNSATAKLKQLFRTNVNIATTPSPSPTRRVPITHFRRRFGISGRSWSRGLSVRRRIGLPSITRTIHRTIMPVLRPSILTLRNLNIPALKIGSLILMPAGSANTSAAINECGVGMAKTDGICVPCPAGTFLSDDMCIHCPSGEYQPQSQQINCLPCKGQSPSVIGATHCLSKNG